MEENTFEVIENFKKANRIKDAVSFCKEKLKDEESRICLRFLSEYYNETNDKKNEKIYLERLLDCESKKADVVLRLMKISGKSKELMEMSIEELISEKREEEAGRIFFELVEGGWFDHEKISKWSERLSNHGKSKIAYDWISQVIEFYKKSFLWDEMESILSFCWKINPSDEVKKTLLFCLREKYKKYPHLEYYIEEMNFHSRKDIPSVLNKLDEVLKYDEGRWVYHDSWGLGLIKEMIPYLDEIVIDFDGKKNHSMNLKGVERIISPLPDDHWVVLTKTQRDKLLTMLKDDPVSLVKIFLKSAGGEAFGLDIKNSISSDLGVLDNWWNVAREKLKNCIYIDYASGGKGGKFSLRKKPRSPVKVFEPSLEEEDELEKQYDKLLDFLQSAKKQTLDEDLEDKALNVFKRAEMRFKEAPPVLRLKFHFLSLDFKKRFKKISLEKIDLSNLTDEEILDLAESSIRTDMKVKLIKTLIASSRIDENLRRRLLTAKSFGFRDVLSDGNLCDDVNYILDHPTESPEALIWAIEIFKTHPDNFKERQITDSTLAEWVFLIAEEHSAGKEDRSKKITSKLRELLKKDDYLIVKNAILESPLQQAKLVLNWINDLYIFNAVQKSEIRTKLIRLRPEIVVSENLLEQHSDSVYVTKRSYLDRQSLRDKLIHETLPSIVEEIRRTAAMGDLSENFEYHAARSKHREIAAKIAELEDQLAKTRVIDENFVETTNVSIGTEVILSSKGEIRKYSILGPWDSDPENGIISYLSPLGAKMLGLKAGDSVEVDEIIWKIEDIQIFEGLAENRADQRRKMLEEDEFRNVIEKGKTDDEDRRNYEERRKK